MNIRIQQIATTYCPIEGWKETDNCLSCKFFGGLNVYPVKDTSVGMGVSLVCNKPDVNKSTNK